MIKKSDPTGNNGLYIDKGQFKTELDDKERTEITEQRYYNFLYKPEG